MKQQTVVEGFAFIIPNQVTKLEEFSEPEWQMEKLRRLCGIKANYGDRMIQIWVGSVECDNWNSSYCGFQKILGMEELNERTRDNRLVGYFPQYFPVQIFDKKMEGDVITFECEEYNVTIKLTCKQLGYRYERFGRFEEVYDKLVG